MISSPRPANPEQNPARTISFEKSWLDSAPSRVRWNVPAERAPSSQAYSRPAVRRILKISESRLRSWERRGFFEPREKFSFNDLIVLKTLQRLRQQRVSAERIKESLDALAKRLDGVKRPLWECKIVPDGRRVAVELPGGRMDAMTGQLMLNFEPSSAKRVETLEGRRGISADRVREAELWFQKGLELEEDDAFLHASIEAYRRALELNPRAAGAWVNIGTLRYRQRKLQEAERCYIEALKISPSYALAHFNLGNICEETDRLDEAVNHYRLALKIQPAYADAHYNLALVYERLGEPMRAAWHWRSYLKLDSESPWASIARQQLQRLVPVTPGGRGA